ncbi:MAG: excinuclease ABC subunit UvrA [Planctomycetota bacterium]|nr:excinuclease ABC subunit UvrA [Planctomycetota bacterium]
MNEKRQMRGEERATSAAANSQEPRASSQAAIRIRGAREHNLKNINVDIPRDRLVVITGLSGSGKSTLAFDTIYAEGQRRYVESLSAYARQFLEMMEKPDIESIEGLTPTIAIEQRTGAANPRSTVATTTEIYDYLRVLFARIGTPHCHVCGRVIESQSAEKIVDQILQMPEGTRLNILAPLVRGMKGEHREIFAAARREGFARLRVDGKIVDAREIEAVPKTFKHNIEAVVDRLVLKAGLRSRLTDSVELALKVGEGMVIAGELQGGEGGGGKDYLFSEKYACPEHGSALEELSPRMFSFNSPYGACPTCAGLGTKMEVDVDLLVPDKKLSVEEGIIQPLWRLGHAYAIWYSRAIRRFCRAAGVITMTPVEQLPKDFFKALLYGVTPKQEREWNVSWDGLAVALTERFHATENENIKARIHELMSDMGCPDCKGARLRPEVLAVRVGDRNIREIVALTIAAAMRFFATLPLSGEKAVIAAPVLKEVRERLGFLNDVGLGYITLDRTSGTLSGGEAQRIRLASQVGSKLVGVTYVLDEPTIGLHQRDNDRLLDTLIKLRDLGNTVIVVEHDEEVMSRADHLIDMGPGAGEHGGEVVATGSIADLGRCERSLTGRYLTRQLEIPLPKTRRPVGRLARPSHEQAAGEAGTGRGFVRVKGARENNLKAIDVDIPLGRFVCVTGVSGSGKSSLVNEVVYKNLARQLSKAHVKGGACDRIWAVGGELDKTIDIDQSPIGRTPRSNPATYTGVFDEVRKLFASLPEARIRGYNLGRFSFNVKGGRCEECQGQGQKLIEMHFLADVYVRCEQCKGRRFNRETLEVKYKDLSIADVLALSVDSALALFRNHPKIKEGLQTLHDVGLGYIRLGQSSTTLSGGEAQRIKLAFELAKKATGHTLYVLDEPTTGLHFHDIAKLLDVLQRLVDVGNTVIVIEHNLDVVKQADWIIDLGPEGGEAGGRVLAVGTPEQVCEQHNSFTGQYLKMVLGARVLAASNAT